MISRMLSNSKMCVVLTEDRKNWYRMKFDWGLHFGGCFFSSFTSPHFHRCPVRGKMLAVRPLLKHSGESWPQLMLIVLLLRKWKRQLQMTYKLLAKSMVAFESLLTCVPSWIQGQNKLCQEWRGHICKGTRVKMESAISRRTRNTAQTHDCANSHTSSEQFGKNLHKARNIVLSHAIPQGLNVIYSAAKHLQWAVYSEKFTLDGAGTNSVDAQDTRKIDAILRNIVHLAIWLWTSRNLTRIARDRARCEVSNVFAQEWEVLE